ncbi:hypothetical protein Lcor42L_04985 [Loigolactobacillus coryniformis subsp. torquens]|jgi:hypothetical protein|nr:hypothetical protein [Loigolactobacillus coryniformis subsp. torquens]MBW4806381.1 hypothetical protein [Loigolactobacillus coryniformis subsp. torquens]
MRTNDLVSLYVSFVETNGGKSRPVLIRRVSEQTVEAFKITSQYEKKSAYIKQQYYPIQDWQSAGLKKPSWVDLGNIYRFPKAGSNFKEIGHLRTCLDTLTFDLILVKLDQKQEFLIHEKLCTPL